MRFGAAVSARIWCPGLWTEGCGWAWAPCSPVRVSWSRGCFHRLDTSCSANTTLGGRLCGPQAGRVQGVLRPSPGRAGGQCSQGLGETSPHRTLLPRMSLPHTLGALLVGRPRQTNTFPVDSRPFSLLQSVTQRPSLHSPLPSTPSPVCCPSSEASSPHNPLGRRGAGNGQGGRVRNKGSAHSLYLSLPSV